MYDIVFLSQIYQSSVAYGPESTKTSGGYYHLGRAFMAENKPDIAISLHDQVGVVNGHGQPAFLTVLCVCVFSGDFYLE